MKVSMQGDVATISLDHPEAGTEQLLLMESLGTTEPDFVNGLIGQLANIYGKGAKEACQGRSPNRNERPV
jgi:hypothetical protein